MTTKEQNIIKLSIKTACISVKNKAHYDINDLQHVIDKLEQIYAIPNLNHAEILTQVTGKAGGDSTIRFDTDDAIVDAVYRSKELRQGILIRY